MTYILLYCILTYYHLTHAHTYIHTYIHTCIHAYILIHAHAYTNTHKLTHAYMLTPSRSSGHGMWYCVHRCIVIFRPTVATGKQGGTILHRARTWDRKGINEFSSCLIHSYPTANSNNRNRHHGKRYPRNRLIGLTLVRIAVAVAVVVAMQEAVVAVGMGARAVLVPVQGMGQLGVRSMYLPQLLHSSYE